MKKEITYDQVFDEVIKLGISSHSEKHRTRVLLTNIIYHQVQYPEKTVNEIITIEEAKMGDMQTSLTKVREQLEDKLHRSNIPEQLLNGMVLENTISYVINKLNE